MCGVVGYSGTAEACPILLDSLDALEYRGYDSAGIAVQLPNGEFHIVKSVGHVTKLRDSLGGTACFANTGIAHTRWATHGVVNEANAHPHVSYNGKVAIAHNGIVENHEELRRSLMSRGIAFLSQTDSEAIAHLIALRCQDGDDLHHAARQVALTLEGLSVIVAMSSDEPGVIVGVRTGHAGSLILGESSEGAYLTSSISGMPDDVQQITNIEHCEAVKIAPDRTPYLTHLDGTPTEGVSVPRPATPSLKARAIHPHFMLKEIMEQPAAVQGAMRGRADFSKHQMQVPEVGALGLDADGIDRVLVVGMGSSYFVALSAADAIELIAGIPARPVYAGELSDAELVITPNTLVVAITQSGETYDTLLAMDKARNRGAKLAIITANLLSEGAKTADVALDIGTGIEMAVPATKTVTCSLLTSLVLAHQLRHMKSRVNGHVPARITAADSTVPNDGIGGFTDALASLPRLMNLVLGIAPECDALASGTLANATSMIVMGRGSLFPIALEGALKMKEVAYIHAEGCSAAEMKHGINALIDAGTPTVALVSSDQGLRTKMLSSISEVKTRGGEVIAIASERSVDHLATADYIIPVPDAPHVLEPLVMLPPLQLLSYHCAISRGINPDRPRNLAKTVTVA